MNNTHNSTGARSTMIYALIAVTALLLGVLFNWTASQKSVSKQSQGLQLKSGTWLSPPRSAFVPSLTDHEGKTFGINELKGSWSFLFFGYTNCPDVCPATMYHFKQLAGMLDKQAKSTPATRFILVSVDPKRDNASHLKDYVKFYHPDFIGLTGNEKDLLVFSRHHGVIYEAQEAADPKEPDSYLVDHSAAILLLNPNAQLQAVFSAPHNPEKIFGDLQTIFEHTQSK